MISKDILDGDVDRFLAACKARRTHYALDKCPDVPDQKVIDIVQEAILHTPSAFNSQTTRMLILFGEEHDYLWNEIAKPTVKAVAPAEVWPITEQKLSGFAKAHGTILLFESRQDVATLQQNFPLYQEHFPTWAEHTDGMCTFVIWTALTQEGLGANLQHYNPLIDAKVAEHFNISDDWKLRAQLVFGRPTGSPKEKTFKPLADRVVVRGASKAAA